MTIFNDLIKELMKMKKELGFWKKVHAKLIDVTMLIKDQEDVDLTAEKNDFMLKINDLLIQANNNILHLVEELQNRHVKI